MDDTLKNSTPDGTAPLPSANPSTPTVASLTLPLADVAKLPELSFIAYAKTVARIARDVEIISGISMLVPIVQSAHESRNGNSGLARHHCNLFGITATDSWKKSGNPVAALPTFEYINGHKMEMTREFRAYQSWRDSFFDWARLLMGLSVYKKALGLLRDPATIITGIAEMGRIYATDPNYAKQLLALYALIPRGDFDQTQNVK